MRKLSRFLSLVVTLLSLGVGSAARAELSPAERATAEALFQRGVALMDQGSYDEACAAFAATLDLEKGLGTMLRLADCYDHQGKTASAWALFKEVASSAGLNNDTVRQQISTERANELEARLSLIKLTVVEPRAIAIETTSDSDPATANNPGAGITSAPVVPHVTLGGSVIPKPMWDTTFPIDPGTLPIEVSAPGYETWRDTIVMPKGPALKSVIVPALSPEQPKSPEVDIFASRTSLPTPTPKAVPTTSPENTSGGSIYKPLGYVLTVVGLLSVGTSAYLTYQAHDLNQESRLVCQPDDPNACTPGGVKLREEAQWYADMATITGASGGVLAATGLALVVFSPSTPQRVNQRGSAPLSVGLRGAW